VKIPFQVLRPSLVTPERTNLASEVFAGSSVNVNREPANVQVSLTAAGAEQPAVPPVPALMKLISSPGSPETGRNVMKGVGVNPAPPTTSGGSFRVAIPFCPLSFVPMALAVRVNIDAVNGDASLFHVIVE